MSRKRANGERIDVMRKEDMMMCMEDVDFIKYGWAYKMADVEEYSSIAQENDSSPKRSIVSCNFVNYLKVEKYFLKIKD